jgi:hypothetical protein
MIKRRKHPRTQISLKGPKGIKRTDVRSCFRSISQPKPAPVHIKIATIQRLRAREDSVKTLSVRGPSFSMIIGTDMFLSASCEGNKPNEIRTAAASPTISMVAGNGE